MSFYGPRPTFGATAVGNLETAADVNRLVQNYDDWIPKLRLRFASLKSQWEALNADECASFEKDLSGLEERWAKAHAYAKSINMDDASRVIGALAITVSGLYSLWASGNFDAGVPAQWKYYSYLWAIRQGGEGAPLEQGDYADLLHRLETEEATLQVTPTPAFLPASPVQVSDDQGLAIIRQTNAVPTPGDIAYWLKLLAVAVAAGVGVQLISNVMLIRIGAKEVLKD